NIARRGGEADLNGQLVVLQNEMPVAPCGAMAFINDDDIEVTRRVVLEEELGVLAALVAVQSLIRGDEDAGVFLRIFRVHFGGVVAECGLEIGEAVVAQFGAIAKEQSAPHKPCVEDATQY